MGTMPEVNREGGRGLLKKNPGKGKYDKLFYVTLRTKSKRLMSKKNMRKIILRISKKYLNARFFLFWNDE